MTVRVLVADDHPMFREGLRAMLAGRPDFDVVAAVGSGAEAVALTQQLRPNVAVLDLRMPDGDGIAATAQIRAEVPETRVLVLSSFEGQAEVAGALAAGAHGYLLKSAHPDEIAQAILTIAAGSSVLSDHVLGDLTDGTAHGEGQGAVADSEGTRAARFVATVLFSDIVDSTAMAEVQGDAAWIHLLDQHDELIDRDVAHFRGRLIKHTGDGILAVFDSPGQAVRCALSLHQSIATIGVKIRVGVHTGEIDRRGNDIGGIAVHIAARVLGRASAGEVLVSRTVVDLTAGGAIRYEALGEVDLKGLAGRRELFRAIS
jgi:DNA-binding NarL/FixJ family response regulator